MPPSDARIRELADIIVTHAQDTLSAHLEIGRLLAVEFYKDDLKVYRYHSDKPMSLRKLQRHLETNYDMPRSFSSLAELIGVHFQELTLNLAPEEKFLLSWSSRVALLRLHTPADKQKWAGEAVLNHWSARELTRRIRASRPPERNADKQVESLNRLTRRMEKELSKWTGIETEKKSGIGEALSGLRKLVVTPMERLMELKKEVDRVEMMQRIDRRFARINAMRSRSLGGVCTPSGPQIIVINDPSVFSREPGNGSNDRKS